MITGSRSEVSGYWDRNQKANRVKKESTETAEFGIKIVDKLIELNTMTGYFCGGSQCHILA
jgi:hypothetical protein